MTLDEKKLDIISSMNKELLRLGIPIQEGDIRTMTNGNAWLLWIEQPDGLDSSSDKFLVNLEELNEWINYSTAIGYRVQRWTHLLKDKMTQGKSLKAKNPKETD